MLWGCTVLIAVRQAMADTSYQGGAMKRLIAAVFVAALVVSACSPSLEDAQAAFCDDLSTLFDTMGGITGEPNIEPSTSVEVVKSYATDVADDYEDVVSSAQDLEEAVLDEIESLNADFQDAVDSIPDDGTMAEVFEQFAGAWGAYVVAVGATLNRDCGDDSTG
jgi:nucleotide-binding universal stress UspA family protein